MNFAIFASFIVFTIWLNYELGKRGKLGNASEKEFWAKERAANKTRRKSLDDLNYIKIPFDELPITLMQEDERVADCVRMVKELGESPIVNFTGLTNTDLMLRYGAPNIDILMRYDQSYTMLARTLQQWAKYLYDGGYVNEACQILEFAVSTGTDVSSTYRLLCKIYKETGSPEKISSLYPTAESLDSAMKGAIVRILQESERSSC